MDKVISACYIPLIAFSSGSECWTRSAIRPDMLSKITGRLATSKLVLLCHTAVQTGWG